MVLTIEKIKKEQEGYFKEQKTSFMKPSERSKLVETFCRNISFSYLFQYVEYPAEKFFSWGKTQAPFHFIMFKLNSKQLENLGGNKYSPPVLFTIRSTTDKASVLTEE